MKAKAPVQTLPQYDEELLKDAKLPDGQLAPGFQRGADDLGNSGDKCPHIASTATSSYPPMACWRTPIA